MALILLTEDAVRLIGSTGILAHRKNQVAVALIACLSLHLAKTSARLTSGSLAFARPVRATLMHGRDLDRLERPPSLRIDTQHLTFDWSPA